MASAAEGFTRGFAGTLAPIILERKKEAREYFNKQVEYARTTGLQNRQKVKSQADATLSVARQLEQIGVPKEVIMAQVNQDPAGLAEFYTQAQKINGGANAPLTPDQWKDLHDIGGDFKAPDEDLATFIARTYDPIANATQAPGFQQDPKGSWLASMMGFSAMDEARTELGQTQIAEGLTADQLIQYGDVQPQRIGGTAVVTTNQEALKKLIPEGDLSISESTAVAKSAEEVVSALENQSAVDGAAIDIEGLALEDLRTLYPTVPEARLQSVVRQMMKRRGLPIGDAEAGAEGSSPLDGGEGSPEGEDPSTVSSEPLNDREVGIAIANLKRGEADVVSVVNNGDGSVTAILSDGTLAGPHPAQKFRSMLITQFGQ